MFRISFIQIKDTENQNALAESLLIGAPSIDKEVISIRNGKMKKANRHITALKSQ
jgi:hypothetical protein